VTDFSDFPSTQSVIEDSRFVPAFIVGAPRSGTTWLQELMGSHPSIATPQEIDLFSQYLSSWFSRWEKQRQADDMWPSRRFKGLPAILREDEFVTLLRSLVLQIYRKILSLKPSSNVVLLKSPQNTLCAPLILKIFPDARFLHIHRDGRDVAASLVRVSRTWGTSWAPSTVGQAAALWARYISAAQQIADLTPSLVHVRYEDLLAGDADALCNAFDLMGISAHKDYCEQLLTDHSLQQAKKTEGASSLKSMVWDPKVVELLGEELKEPDGFIGGRRGTWQSEWSAYEKWKFDQTAGGLLKALGHDRGSLGQRSSVSKLLKAYDVLRQSPQAIRRTIMGSRSTIRKARQRIVRRST
jgi:hypothetical protein